MILDGDVDIDRFVGARGNSDRSAAAEYDSKGGGGNSAGPIVESACHSMHCSWRATAQAGSRG
jgi:hypothetical protein